MTVNKSLYAVFFAFIMAQFILMPSVLAESCQLKQAAEFTLTNRIGSPLITKGKILDEPVSFNLSIAGAASGVTEGLAKKLKIDPQKDYDGRYTSSNKKTLRRNINLPDFYIGTKKIQGGEYPIFDGVQEEYVSLGMDYLSFYEIEIDSVGKKLRLFDRDHCRGAVVYWSRQYLDEKFRRNSTGKILVPVIVNGTEIEAEITTSSSYSSISASFIGDSSDGRDQGAQSPKKTILKTVEFAGLRFKDLEAFVENYDRSGSSIAGTHLNTRSLDHYDMVIGMDILSKLRVFISYEENKIYLTLADAQQ